MAESVPSLELLADETRAERESLTRHADTVDAKAGVILGFASALAALEAGRGGVAASTGSALATLAALVASAVLWPRPFPAWDVRRVSEEYLAADPRFTERLLFENAVTMVEKIQRELQVKVGRLRGGIALLALAAIAFLTDTMI
ncbi:MAG TPA: hypothetical protein VFC33_11195 [Acidimicrobiia bacterium]|nr:hypothetical protein [Acidimicrobiia bacterium]